MPEVVELREVTDRRDVIHRAVQRLSSGDLVALPSEAGFVLAGAALVEGTSQRLPPDGITLLLRATEEVADYLPLLSPVGLRIAKRCWPGPLVLQAPATATDGFVAALPESSRAAVLAAGQLSVRVSSHPVWVMRLNPLTYGVAGLRRLMSPTLVEVSASNSLPSLWTCLAATCGFCLLTVTLACWLTHRRSVINVR